MKSRTCRLKVSNKIKYRRDATSSYSHRLYLKGAWGIPLGEGEEGSDLSWPSWRGGSRSGRVGQAASCTACQNNGHSLMAGQQNSLWCYQGNGLLGSLGHRSSHCQAAGLGHVAQVHPATIQILSQSVRALCFQPHTAPRLSLLKQTHREVSFTLTSRAVNSVPCTIVPAGTSSTYSATDRPSAMYAATCGSAIRPR